MIPGDPEKAYQADREAHGIPLSPALLNQFNTIAEELQIEPIPIAAE